MFSQQQASPQFTQQNTANMYNGNGMNLNNASMASSNMGQIAGQMSVTSMASGPSPSLPSMGQEQVNVHKHAPVSEKYTCYRVLGNVFSISRSNIL